MTDTMEEMIRKFLNTNFADAIICEENFRGQQSFYIRREYLFELCQALHSDKILDFNFLTDVCSLDWLGKPDESEGRFEVIYNLYSITNKYRLLLKVRLSSDAPAVDTLVPIWQSANWLEREVYDLMGIVFVGHPDLRKIVTPEDLVGHPLRKDFPLTYEMPQFSYNKLDPPEVIK